MRLSLLLTPLFMAGIALAVPTRQSDHLGPASDKAVIARDDAAPNLGPISKHQPQDRSRSISSLISAITHNIKKSLDQPIPAAAEETLVARDDSTASSPGCGLVEFSDGTAQTLVGDEKCYHTFNGKDIHAYVLSAHCWCSFWRGPNCSVLNPYWWYLDIGPRRGYMYENGATWMHCGVWKY